MEPFVHLLINFLDSQQLGRTCLCADDVRLRRLGFEVLCADGTWTSTPVMSMASGSNAVLSLSHQASKSAGLRMTKAQELLKSWEVDACDLFLFDQLGEGGQAVVLRGQLVHKNGLAPVRRRPVAPVPAQQS